jgi:GT2 family glycosyltransferase
MLTALIISHRPEKHLQDCIESIKRQSSPPSRIIVVLTSDSDFEEAGVEVLRLPANPGYSAAVNQGMNHCRGDDVLLLNDDTVLLEGCIETLRSAAENPGIYQPMLLFASDERRLENAGHWIFPDGFNFARGRGQPAGTDLPARLPIFSGAAAYLHREVIEKTGPFDEDLYFFGEDVDWSLRSMRLGYGIHYVSEARILHVLGASMGRGGPRKVHLIERNRIQAAIRSLPGLALATMPFWTLVRLGLMGAGRLGSRGTAVEASRRAYLAVFTGQAAGLARLPVAWKKRRKERHRWKCNDVYVLRMLWEGRPPLRDVWHPNTQQTGPE